MPFADPEKRKSYGKEYRLKKRAEETEEEKKQRKAKAKEYRRRHYLRDMEWLKKNREEAMKSWTSKTLTDLQRDFNKRVNGWKKSHNIKSADWEAVYKRFVETTHCEFCGIKFEIGVMTANKRCVDHHHSSGEIRNILCNTCNSKRKIPDLKFMYVLQELHRYFIEHNTTI